MLTEIAIADAYGAGFEFCATEKINAHNNLVSYCQHELYDISGQYTDDTQMSIAIAEFILSGAEWNKENIATKFIECFQRDIRVGYSEGFYNLLTQVGSGKELLNKLISTSERNGAAMRSVPIGFLKNRSDVITFATLQAQITHDTKLGIASSCSVSLAAYFGLQEKGRLAELKSFLECEGLDEWDFNWQERVSLSAYDTVSAAFTCLLKHDSMSSLLKACIQLGGDTDSVASIAIGLATCFTEYKNDLPNHLFKMLKENDYGIPFLKSLDNDLINLLNSTDDH
ncbi:crystallin J1 [Acinetobacter sp. NRRL B-65365]|uniref:ADP-ribosylglycohydrolase family protein n=1 Tax=Acinetobacter sp. NRRL B-65365 TaxID=1785092 RepID=UPI0007A030DF|nr:ADP-ribosylglycohydrolase family protein [Acinetobacter sp. NRRL B-65365]KYQ83536.1 crystallin J1 [Acinetobacter sp. NRRL B-65365]